MTLDPPDPRVDDPRVPDGAAHLRALAQAPRAAGSAEERAAREYCAGVLRGLGFDVAIEQFEYSALPGKFGTPVAGALAMVTVIASACLAGLYHAPRAAAYVLAGGLLILGIFAWRMLGDGVLDLPWMRQRGENLVARRGAEPPRAWLVAHVDSKSQPIPSKERMLGITLLALSIVLAVIAIGMTLALGSTRTILYLLCVGLAAAGGRAVVYSVVRNESAGAVDNASGVAAVLSAAAKLDPSAAVGLLIPSAEELGLAGARAWVRAHAAEQATVLNCDGVDDQGELTIMYTRARPAAIVDAVQRVASNVNVRRMPPGLLLDSVAFADRGWSAVTVSHGSMRTLARVHTKLDSLENLSGHSIEPTSAVLARVAEALSR